MFCRCDHDDRNTCHCSQTLDSEFHHALESNTWTRLVYWFELRFNSADANKVAPVAVIPDAVWKPEKKSQSGPRATS